MTMQDDDFNPRPGRIRHGNQVAKRPKSFVGEVMRAAKKAGHRGWTFGPSGRSVARSTFGWGCRAALSLAYRSSSRRVVVMARIVRHRAGGFLPRRSRNISPTSSATASPVTAQKPMRRTASCPFGAGLPRIAWQFYCSIAAV